MNGKTKMKHMRDKEFLDMYHEALMLMTSSGVANARRAAILYTIYNGKPHYHVSYERAYLLVCRILKSGNVPIQNPRLRAMWGEIAGHVRHLVNDRGISISKAVEFVIANCRASRFYISEEYGWRHTYEASRERKRALLSRFVA